MLNRSSECAIAAMSLLAELWGEDCERLTAMQVAERRRLTKPFVAKVLTILSQVGLVKGAPGPRGGYCLGRPPEEITLLDITRCFERADPAIACPYGPDFCGVGDNKCPIHDEVVSMQEQKDAFLARTTLAVFRSSGKELPSPYLK